MVKLPSYFHKNFETLNLITLNKNKFVYNINIFRDLTKLPVAPVLKANAYGHGLKQISSILSDKHDIPFIAVDFYKEALVVQKETNSPVLVMGAINPVNFKNIRLTNLLFAVSRSDTVKALGELGEKVKVHIEIDTGMARQGVSLEGLDELLLLIKSRPNIQVDGIMSHLADADNPNDDAYNAEQTAKFNQAVELIKSHGFAPTWIHLAQSAGSTRALSKYVNAVRPGIALFGINPLSPSDKKFELLQKTKPVLSAWSTIIALQQLLPGQSVSYGRTFKAEKPMLIGVIPFGYYEGLPRALSNKAVLLSENSQAISVRGRICMNHTMLDVTKLDLKIGDKIKVISENRNDPNSVQALCDSFGLFNYEFLVKINEQTRRTVI